LPQFSREEQQTKKTRVLFFWARSLRPGSSSRPANFIPTTTSYLS